MSSVITPMFRSLAALRRARAVHPRGVVLAGEVVSVSTGSLPLQPGPVLARLSKGAGTPGALPDALGLALRFGASSAYWDLLLTTSMGGRRIGRMLPWPLRTWNSDRYCSLMAYRVDDRTLWFGAEVAGLPADRASVADVARSVNVGPLRLRLKVAVAGAPWRPAAEIVLSRINAEEPAIAFDPVAAQPPGLRLTPSWLVSMRAAAYSGSREGRLASS
ncbi:hypothetical protein BS329_39480 [Amycolatopsis coloradensis]|uniref:Phosphodiesterase n=1 Tax=Amycolatopsis coloradensis TaxID=76021 RepID=A0A1R0KED7_9PSEU|nr:hypothetical protein BS329_39480 [Amycolatopsis coloradensis]